MPVSFDDEGPPKAKPKMLRVETGRVSFSNTAILNSSERSDSDLKEESMSSVTSSTSPRASLNGDKRGLLKRQSTVARLSFSSRSSAREIMARNSLSYNTKSWRESFKIVFNTFYNDSFLLIPWALISSYSVVVAIIGEALEQEVHFIAPTSISMGVVGSMALLLAFRLNVCYNRWWEGRNLWGVAITASRGIVTRLLAEGEDYFVEVPPTAGADSPSQPEPTSPNAVTPKMAAGYCVGFVFVLRKHLLGERLDPDAVPPGLMRLLNHEQLQNLARAQHPPLHALHCLRFSLSRLSRMARRAQQSIDGGGGAVALEMALLQPTQEMHMMLAGCERLVSTPCPAGYVGVLRMVLIFFLLTTPHVLLHELGYWMIPVASVTTFAILAVEACAMAIEQPFGTDDDDLPLEAYCLNLLADVLALMDEEVPVAMQPSPDRRAGSSAAAVAMAARFAVGAKPRRNTVTELGAGS